MRGTLEFPAVRGIQAGREYYVSMCPLGFVHKIFIFNEKNEKALTPEMRVQRHLNRSRVPEIARYLVSNPSSYVFSAITASIDGEAVFRPFDQDVSGRHGTLEVPMSSKIILNDGQHRQAAIAQALLQSPELADETIAVVLFHDRGLARCQQMFSDLNRYAVRPPRSLNVLYDHRDDRALVAKHILKGIPDFADLVELERSSLSARAKQLFTLSALYTATAALFVGHDFPNQDARGEIALDFWRQVSAVMPHWGEVRSGQTSSGALRDEYIHSHGVTLHALGRVGNTLLKAGMDLSGALPALGQIDWRRSSHLWKGRAVVAGRMSKSHQAVILTGNQIKMALKLPLSAEERILEDNFMRQDHVA
ncbi:DNA sulfur modification protein DndB [Agrobacterium larrymoorei]|uniref:DNA sulfur modification protein DndB n=1 Tax=Agrobacterium larrymoorei TaxID=160699 RepID=A0A4D7E6C2_9HYPH|nr:DNA sulfur modification protein DndB [Agrobacterium larrymoorei]QCJ00891.1 DNA sulfur modification protein DndB [Agrobacterium larrymoorei]QYA10227.1 DNA sulfur modification protein DndB [Agrobacterium larrymoorei]